MKIISSDPFIATRMGPDGYEIVCRPGPLPDLLRSLSDPGPIPLVTTAGYITMPITPEVDQALVTLAQAFIDIRYTTNQVQLELYYAPTTTITTTT